MAIKDSDKVFQNKVQEYYTLELVSIQKQLGNLRDKTIVLEQIRKENLYRISELYTVSSGNHHYKDLYRSLLIDRFFIIYHKFANNPVAAFLHEELPKLKLVVGKNSGQTLGLDNKPAIDLQFFQRSTNEDILELITKAFVFKAIEIFLFQHLHREYANSGRKEKLQHLMEHRLGSVHDYLEEEDIINKDFKDWKAKFQQALTDKPLTMEEKTDKKSYHSQALKLPFLENLFHEYLKILYKGLMDGKYIAVNEKSFLKHFTGTDFEKITWNRNLADLAYLFKVLGITGQFCNKLMEDHFLDKDGKEIKTSSIASTKTKQPESYPDIDKIISKIKESKFTINL